MDYQKKIKRCENLGADKFQKVVFKVEKAKYKVIKKLFPNFIKHYDKHCDKRCKKELEKSHSEDRKKEIINYYRNQKLIIRKEFNREQNRNYHIDSSRPLEFLQYLEWNKNIHKSGLIKNILAIPIFAVATAVGFTPAIPLLLFELGSSLINFQCINIQNYNIYRIKEREESLKRHAKRVQERKQRLYKEGAEVISKTLEEKKEQLPTTQDIINNIDNKEQLDQIRQLVLSTIKDREKVSTIKGGVK